MFNHTIFKIIFGKGLSKRKRASKALILFVAGLLLVLGILDYVSPRIDITPYRKEITTSISQLLQRKFDLGDKLYLKLSLKPTLVTDRLIINNPAWCKATHFLKAEEVEFGIDVIDFLLGKITIDRLIVTQARLNLEQTEENKNNWTFGKTEKVQQENDKSANPVRLDYVMLDDVNIHFTTPKQQEVLYIKHAFLKKTLRRHYRLDFNGEFNKRKLIFQASSNRWLDLQDIRPLNIKIDTDMNGNDVSASIYLQKVASRVQVSLKIDSGQINLDDLSKQFAFGTQKNERADSENILGDWINKIDFFSVELKIDKLFYMQREIRDIVFRSQFILDESSKDGRFSVKGTGKLGEIIHANVPRMDSLTGINMLRYGQFDFSVNSKASSMRELVGQAAISFRARDITGNRPGPYIIKKLTAETDNDRRLFIKGEINYNNKPVRVTAQTGKNFLGELQTQAMMHLDMSLSTNVSSVTINSTSRDIFKKGARKMHLKLSGNNLKEWEPIAGRELPVLEHYKLESRLKMQKKGIRVKKFTLITPASLIRGKLFYRYGQRGTLNLRVEKSRLALSDLRMEPREKEKKESSEKSKVSPMVIPKTDLMKLLSPAMEINFEASESDLIFNKFTIHDMELKTRWGDKVLATQIYKGQISGGALTADIYLTVVDEEAAGKIEMNIKQLDYGKFMQEVGVGDKMKGKADVNIHLVGFGKDFKEFLSRSDGSAEFVGEKGILASKYLRLWGEDIVQQILPFNWFDREQTNINCVVGRFDLTDGRLSSDSLLLDTKSMTIAGTGAINLASEELAFELMPDPKNISLLSLATPVKIRGTLAKPRIEPHVLGTTWTIGSLLLGLANPAILIARFAKLGSLGENPCLAAIGKKEGEEQETSILKAFKDAVKFIQRPFDKLPDIE